MKLKRVISGGQTGADQGGLFAARAAGLETGGWAPRFYRTDEGPMPDLLQSFGLVETDSDRYPIRTRFNIRDSDATLIVAVRFSSAGTKLTQKICQELKKPIFCVNPALTNEILPWIVAEWLYDHDVRTLNVAGNRESSVAGIQQFTQDYLQRVIQELREEAKWEVVSSWQDVVLS
jgi:hypothetical protein